ncbi:MAG TPA: asparagine synthase (glutamine-hydrolyzing), partial [Tepidisphaeraceae bacterium]
MSRAIAHRGPDGEGYHLTREHELITPDAPQVGLAFRRLAVLDPDPRSNQPFHIGSLSMVYNGEIYNFRELRAEISKLRPDYRWRTTGDVEVLLMAYEVWRVGCLEKLNGMFAMAVWDEAKKELFLARDRMGQKPLYVANPEGPEMLDGEPFHPVMAFASEPSAFRIPWINHELSLSGIPIYLRLGYSPPGSGLYCWSGAFAQAGWWTFRRGIWIAGGDYFDPNTTQPQEEDSVRMTRRLVEQSVRRQLVSDVPLGCFLSGGADSSVIAAAMTRAVAADQQVMTFSVGFTDARYDETKYAAAVAKHLGTEHRRFTVRPNAAEDLPKLASAFGEPFADSSALPTHYLARETRQYVKVALSGDGGDELFGGYDRYRAMALAARMPWMRSMSFLGAALPSGHPKSRIARAKRFLASIQHAPGAQYAAMTSLFDDMQIDQLLGEDLRKELAGKEKIRQRLLHDDKMHLPDQGLHARFDRLYGSRDAVTAALALDRESYLPNDLLTKVDRCSMLHALEVRSPFMDHELVQFAAGLTTDQLLKGGPKRMLREAFANDLPDFVFKRKKMGFAVPIGEWFRGELRPMLRDNLFASDSFGKQHFNMSVVQRLVDEHEQERVDHSQRLYALLMLELWWRSHRTSG